MRYKLHATRYMKKDIHPKWYPDAQVTCACGHAFTTGATVPEIRVQICSQCHPFFTGEEKFIDALGRVEKFKKKRKEAAQLKKVKKAVKERKKEEEAPKTLREMLMGS